MRTGLAVGLVICALAGCGKGNDKVTREQCAKVADHIADLIVDHYRSHPDELWDGMTAQPGETGLPPDITKDNFKAYLETPEGKTWMMQRHGQARSGTEQGIEQCVQKATPKQVKCLLGAKTREDVAACDKPS